SEHREQRAEVAHRPSRLQTEEQVHRLITKTSRIKVRIKRTYLLNALRRVLLPRRGTRRFRDLITGGATTPAGPFLIGVFPATRAFSQEAVRHIPNQPQQQQVKQPG